jgi:hypothetical protein
MEGQDRLIVSTARSQGMEPAELHAIKGRVGPPVALAG